MFSKIVFSACFILIILVQTGSAAIDFGHVPLCVGKQLLTEKGFYLSQTLGIARITPQAEIPFILSYKSTNEETGIFGKGWRSNLLESSVSGDLWHTPWGEVIKLSENGGRFKKIDRMICGINEYEGWEFLYLFGKLQKIVTPNKKELIFVYEGPEQRISSVRIRNFDFIRLFYQDKVAVWITVGGVTSELKYRNKELLMTVQTSNLYPTEYRYNKKKKLIQISRKDYVDKLTLNAAGELLSDRYYSYERRTDDVKITDQTGTCSYVSFQNYLLTTRDAFGNRVAVKYLKRHDPTYPGQLETIHLNGKLMLEMTYHPHTEQPVCITDRFGNKLLIAYNEKMLPVTYSRQPAGEKKVIPSRTITYNHWKLPEKIIDLAPDGSIRSEMKFKYDDERQIVDVKTEKRRIRFRYNPFGYVNAMSGPHGDFRSIYYDGFNRPSLDVGVQATKMTYNNAGLLSEFRTVTAENKVVIGGQITYDLYGNPACVKFHDGRTVKYERDAFGRILKQYRPDGHFISYGYDVVGNLVRVTDPNDHVLNIIYSKNRLLKQITPAGQVTEYEYNSLGQPISVVFYFADNPKKIDRKLTYQYDVFDRLSEIDFGNGYRQTNQYDKQNRLIGIQRISPGEARSAVLAYNKEGQLIRREETVSRQGKSVAEIVYTYEFDEKGRRILFAVDDGKKKRSMRYAYNEDGQLEEITSGNKRIFYEYEAGRLVKEIVNGTPIHYRFDVSGRLISKKIGTTELKYFWSPEGRLIERDFAGKRQFYFYDKLEQLEMVTDNQKKVLEYYKYDPAGNIVEKFARGVKSTFTFDKANQLISGQVGKKKYRYQYDAAGRMISDGHSEWRYGWLNSVVKADQMSYSYDTAGQLVSAGNETFLWDDLALVERNGMLILNTPAMTGGNPVLVGEKIIFHDMLGSSIGVLENSRFSAFSRSCFGEVEDSIGCEADYFTGKPRVANLGYHFLFRNYTSMTGKWTNADPLGYLDGWNNFGYCSNNSINFIDHNGGFAIAILPAISFAFKCYAFIKVTQTVNEKILEPTFNDLAYGTKTADASVLSATPDLMATAALGGLGNMAKGSLQILGGLDESLADATVESTGFMVDQTINRGTQMFKENNLSPNKNISRFSNSYATYEEALAANRFSNSYATYKEALAHQKMNHTIGQQSPKNTVAAGYNGELVKDDAPAAVVRAFFTALANGDIQHAEKYVDPACIAMLKWWLAAYWTGQEYLWIGPVSYIWDNGRKAAVENSREGRSNGILLVKIGNAWKIRLTMQCCNAVSIPKSIAEKNTKATMICVGYLFIGRDKIADMRYRIEYIVRFKNIGSCD